MAHTEKNYREIFNIQPPGSDERFINGVMAKAARNRAKSVMRPAYVLSALVATIAVGGAGAGLYLNGVFDFGGGNGDNDNVIAPFAPDTSDTSEEPDETGEVDVAYVTEIENTYETTVIVTGDRTSDIEYEAPFYAEESGEVLLVKDKTVIVRYDGDDRLTMYTISDGGWSITVEAGDRVVKDQEFIYFDGEIYSESYRKNDGDYGLASESYWETNDFDKVRDSLAVAVQLRAKLALSNVPRVMLHCEYDGEKSFVGSVLNSANARSNHEINRVSDWLDSLELEYDADAAEPKGAVFYDFEKEDGTCFLRYYSNGYVMINAEGRDWFYKANKPSTDALVEFKANEWD